MELSMELGCKQQQEDGVVNDMTRAEEALSPWLNNPRRTIVQVEALVVTVTVLLLLQFIFGSCKRRWHNYLVKGGLWVSNTLMFPLILYTLSMMQSSPIKNSSYPVWAVVLIIASSGTAVARQYDFYASALKKIGNTAVELARYSFYFLMFLLLMTPTTWKETWNLKKAMHHMFTISASSYWVRVLIALVYVIKAFEGILLLKMEDTDMENCTAVANWMKERVNDHPSDSDPESMEGYNYLVQSPSVTIDKIWASCGISDEAKALKDICLSFALFQLLKRRYLGLACAEAKHPKAHDFFFKKLLPSEGQYKRAFQIVEVELGFCYDYFFTKYDFVYALVAAETEDSTFREVSFFFVFLSGLKIICIFVVGVFALRKSLILETPNPIIEVNSTNTDYSITLLVLGIALIVELLQAAFYLASDWVQVSLACRYVKKNCCQPSGFIEKSICFLRRVTVSRAWRNKISQHSILSGKQYPAAEVSGTVKRAIARSLIATDGDLTNGETSLRQNQNLSWTLNNHSQLEIMLIWHIATEYCDLSEDHLSDGIARGDRGVAVHLSRYSAYLLASVPELLPYHEVDIKESIKDVEEGKEQAGNPTSYEQMKSLDGTEVGDNPTTLLKKGVKLGKQLESMPDGAQRWKVMEEFWAETLVYVTPSHSTTKQHMMHLENGGEFLTHIWTLLSHAGILQLNRDKDQGPEAAEPNSQPTAETA
ncbi:unnamed protein product [Urochloa decumbens]|uniref:DUF4220 domain-containing protein n=1 Tax=Urochloa decumbens TaxID=240449 RepID=A0ABC8W8W1_9POAL